MSCSRHSSSAFWTFAVFSVIALLSSVSQVTHPVEAATRASADLERLVAPPRACPGQGDPRAPVASQERAMRCLVAFARRHAGLVPLSAVGMLGHSARLKSADMLRCDQFDHEACGREFSYWMEQVGYLDGGCWKAAENIAFGTGSSASPREIFDGWIHSSGHRRNILGSFRDVGVGLRIGSLERFGGAHVWTQHFGTLC